MIYLKGIFALLTSLPDLLNLLQQIGEAWDEGTYQFDMFFKKRDWDKKQKVAEETSNARELEDLLNHRTTTVPVDPPKH